MARPVADRLRNIPQKIKRPWRALRQIRAGQAAAIAVALAAVLSLWLIGQAWLAADEAALDPSVNAARESNQARSAPAPAPASARLAIATDAILQGSELTYSGGGFGPFETVLLSAKDPASGEERELGRASTDWQGSIESTTVASPEWLTSGAQQLAAMGERSGSTGTATLYVRAKDRWANISNYGLKQAELLGFVAGGFEPGERVNVYLAEGQDLQPDADAAPVLSVDTDRAGNTAWTQFPVPIVKPGTYSLMFRGDSGGNALSRNIVINALAPSVEISPWSGPPGSKIELNGKGFMPGESVGVYLGDSTESALTLNADEYGDFWGAGPVAIPYDGRGSYRVTLIGETSHALVTRSFGVIAPKPWVELSTYAGFAGTSVFFSGGGFAAGERISVHLDQASRPMLSVGQANEQGYYQFVGPVNVPPDALGQVVFVLVGESTGASGRATFKVLTPWVPGPSAVQP